MRLKIFILVFAIVWTISLVGIVSADFTIGNLSHSIQMNYPIDSFVNGWINMSFDDEPANSLIEDSEGNSIELLKLIKLNTIDYSCNPNSCEPDYSASNEEETKPFSLGANKEKIIGLKFTGSVNEVKSINFSVQSNAGALCFNQLEIDFLNDDKIDFGNDKVGSGECGSLKTKGCFNESASTNEYSAGICSPGDCKKHCQRMTLSKSPGFKIGAWVKKVDSSKNLTMSLRNLYNEELASCILPEASVSGGYISCDVNHLVMESKEYYVCIYQDGGTGSSKIKGYDIIKNACGFYGTEIQKETAAFDIFAQGKKFDSVGTLKVKNSLPSGELNAIIQNYLINRYGRGIDCFAGCVVPIKFISKVEQTITLKELKEEYTTTSGGISATKFYDLKETPALISANFQKIFLDKANLSLPSDYGEIDYELTLNGEIIFSEELNIEEGPTIKSVHPTMTYSAYPTEFRVYVDIAEANISRYEWNFGDGDNETSVINKKVHIYNETGNYTLHVRVIDLDEKTSSKSFQIIVDSPEFVINSTLNKLFNNIANVKKEIDELGPFYKKSLSLVLDLESAEDELSILQAEYLKANTEEDYNKVMSKLVGIEFPESIRVTKKADLMQFYPNTDFIDLGILEDMSGVGYEEDDEDKYPNAIISWNQENINAKISFKEFSAKYDYFEEQILNTFKIDVSKKTDFDYQYYFILNELENLVFKENYLETKSGEFFYIDLGNEESKEIEFAITEEIIFSDLPAFISPKADRLPIRSVFIELPKDNLKLFLFILGMALLIIVGFVSYIILQEWYKRRYEEHLFKNQNSLYNIVSYIQNSRRMGLDDRKIAASLKKSGWKSEQINYAIRKYSGKRTGMLEIPINKILNLFRKKTGATQTSSQQINEQRKFFR